jgi:hypothetical protein
MPDDKIVIVRDQYPQPSAQAHANSFMTYRGAFMSQAFVLENELVLLQLADEFSTIDARLVGSSFFTHEQKLRRKTLGQHVTSCLPLIDQHGELNILTELSQKLKEVVIVRNTLAHQPCWLEPMCEELQGSSTIKKRTSGFKIYIANHEWIWEIDKQQIADWNALLTIAPSIVAVRSRLLETRTQPKSKREIGPIPIGLHIPGDEPIFDPDVEMIVLEVHSDDASALREAQQRAGPGYKVSTHRLVPGETITVVKGDVPKEGLT